MAHQRGKHLRDRLRIGRGDHVRVMICLEVAGGQQGIREFVVLRILEPHGEGAQVRHAA